MLLQPALVLGSAALVGLIHTLVGPDHYLPFMALAAARGWSLRKTFWTTLAGGLAHIGSALALVGLGLAAGLAASSLPVWETWRGAWAGWGLIAFGLVYAVWGWRRSLRLRRPGYAAEAEAVRTSWGAWGLIFIFGLGPCEPMIPVVLLPALHHQAALAWAAAAVFGAVTLTTMLALVLSAAWGWQKRQKRLNFRYADLAAGLMILACGMAVQFLGI